MEWIIDIFVNALVLLIAAKAMDSVSVKSFGTALVVAIIIGVLGWLIGWLLTFVLNMATLGLFYFTGLSFVIRIIVNAIIIEIADKLHAGFYTRGFLPSLYLAIFIAIAGALVDAILY
jgi:putative membrane protein